MTEERKHARLSPSSAERWTTCPGSVQLEQGYPDTSSEHADWGTAAHAVAEMVLNAWNEDEGGDSRVPSAKAYKGRRIDVKAGKTVEVDDEMVQCVDTYTDNIQQRIAMYYAAGALSVDMYVEVEVPIDHITGEEGATGTADCVLVATFLDRVVVDVNDLKGGRGVRVIAEGNKQLLMYADGATRKLGLAEVDEVVCVIHQPRVSETPSEWQLGYEAFSYEVDNIHASAQRAALYLDSTTQLVDSDLRPSEKGCQWCKAKGDCPARDRMVREATGADFENLDVLVGGAMIRALDPPTLAQKMTLVDQIEDWCKAVRAETERRLFDGRDVPGFKLVQGRKGARQWANAEAAEQALKAMRLKQEEMYDFKLISPTTAEKLAKAGTIGPRQWPKLGDLIVQPEGSPSVAPESDKRPALVLTKPSADDFEVIEEDVTGGLV